MIENAAEPVLEYSVSMPAEPWRRALLPGDTTLQSVIRSLNDTGLRIALVVAPNGTLLGTITDGDIRRGLLRGLDLNSPAETIMNRKPMVAPPQLGTDAVLYLMQANGIHQLPVVDDGRLVVGLHLWNELLTPSHRLNLMVVMAGGQGTRLRPRTDDCPKPLLPVGGKPMLEHVVERAKAEGFHRFVLAIHHLGHMIQDYFGDGSRWQVEIDYVREDAPLGTAGALSLISPRPETPIVVSNADVLTDIRYGELLDFHCRNEAMATMAVREHEWQHPFGVVRTLGVDIIGFDEKPITRSHINAGVYVLGPHALDALVVGEHCHMPTLFSRLQESGARTIVYPMHEPWLDIGRPDDLARADSLNQPGQ